MTISHCTSLALLATQVAAALPNRPPAAEVFRDGRALVQAMHDRWSGKWYRTLSFAQRTRTIAEDGTETRSIWYEALEHPGRLRIDYAPLESRSGVICAQDRIFHFKEGRQVLVQETLNPLLTLLGDAYCQPVPRTVAQLEGLGFELGRIRREAWNDRPCWVVGEASGNQFWIDAENLLLQRVTRRDPAKPEAAPRDVRILEFRTVQGFPIASLLHFFRDGKLEFTEDYFDIRVNTPLEPRLFQPDEFGATQVPAAANHGAGSLR